MRIRLRKLEVIAWSKRKSYKKKAIEEKALYE